jgi:hypothetical protein
VSTPRDSRPPAESRRRRLAHFGRTLFGNAGPVIFGLIFLLPLAVGTAAGAVTLFPLAVVIELVGLPFTRSRTGQRMGAAVTEELEGLGLVLVVLSGFLWVATAVVV